MTQATDAITFKGNPVTLEGSEVKVGQAAPGFTAVANDLSPASLTDHRGKVVVISSVPSLDTGVCATQTRKFNEKAGALGDNAVVLTVSMDLPFAQKRWCGAEGVESVVTVSDSKDRAFGSAYGLYIKELGLLARAVVVIDREMTIRYIQIVNEVTQEPDYDAAMEAIRALL